MDNSDKTDDSDKPALRRSGPAPTRSSRQETFRIASKTRREALLASGKIEIKVYISPETKAILATLKAKLKVDTLGDVIDKVVMQQQNSEKK